MKKKKRIIRALKRLQKSLSIGKIRVQGGGHFLSEISRVTSERKESAFIYGHNFRVIFVIL